MTTNQCDLAHHARATARWRIAVASCLAAVGLAVLAAGPGQAAAPSATATGSRSGAPAIAWRACGKRLQCARVRVPLDWSHAGNFAQRGGRGFTGPTISLAIVRYRASQQQRRIGSLFMNFGGPGVAGVAKVREGGEGYDELAKGRFDIIGWDPRGTGESTHVRCFASTAGMTRFWGPNWGVPSTPAESRRYAAKSVAYMRRCQARSGRLLNYISTADTVRDLDYLRSLVGDRQLNYFGESYGTFLGQTYANMFPKRVGRMVMDSFIDPVPYVRSVQAALDNNEAQSDLVFEKFQALCEQAGPANCALAGDGPVAPRVTALLARLRRGPIPAPSAPPPHQLSYGDALTALWLSLGTPASWPKLAEGLNQAADGDGSAIETMVAEQTTTFQEALVPAAALQCADKRLPPPGEIRKWPAVIPALSRSNLVAPVDGWFLWAPCASWRTASQNRYTGPWNATTPNPILLLANRYDPRTAYANALTAQRRLGDAVLVTNNGYGHTTLSDLSTCVLDAIGTYLTTLETPPRGTVCQPDRVPFDPNFGEPVDAAPKAAADRGARPPAGIDPGQQFTGLAASVLSRPRPVRGTDGYFHLAYELVLTGATAFAVDVERVDVRDASSDRVLLELAGDELSSRMNPVGGAPAEETPTTLLAPSGSAVVWLDVRARRKADLPEALEHLVVASTLPQGDEEPIQFSSLVGRVSLQAREPVELGPPVRRGIWVAVEGCCDDDTHHRRGLLAVDGDWTVFQRFAIDWMRLDESHRAWVGDPTNLSSYFSYGQPLLAAADGTVVVAKDGFPNSPPPENPTPPPPEELTGNHVTLRIGPGIYLLYAHMKPGSVRVHVGERVRRGQVLGQLGNSGNSATPHLHLQVQVTRSFLSDGLPFVFDRFQLLGQITEPFTDENLGLRPDGQLAFAPASGSGTRRLEMPLNLDVLQFR